MVLKMKGRGGGVGKQNLSHNSFVLTMAFTNFTEDCENKRKEGGDQANKRH